MYTCSLCNWQSEDGTPADAYRHLQREHDLGRLWENGRIETGS